jgi:hypothetical protein
MLLTTEKLAMVISSVKSSFQHPCRKFNEDVSRKPHQPFQACPAYRVFRPKLYGEFSARFLKCADLAQNSWDRNGRIFAAETFGAAFALQATGFPSPA